MSESNLEPEPSPLMAELQAFKRERNEALMSLDEHRIRAMARKWNKIEMPTDMNVFWGSVHKAITGCLDMPLHVRQNSKAYLDATGLRSLDDGDL